MKATSYVFICLWALIFVSCKNQKPKDEMENRIDTTTLRATNQLAGHVYYFAPEIDSINCKVFAECDCCDDDFLFINEKEFIRIGYCVSEKSVIKGTYFVDRENLILNYDSVTYYTEADDNNKIRTVSKNSSEYLIQMEKGKPFLDTIFGFSCNGKLFYKSLDEKLYGSISSSDSINTYIDELKSDGFWKKMNF